MSGSVKDFTARRARNTIKHFNDVDYDDDWSKLNEWGQKFMELNQECLFHLEKDEENRCNVQLWPRYLALVCVLHVGPNMRGGPSIWPLYVFCMLALIWPKYSAPNRFKRCFVSLGPMLNVAYGCGMKFAGVDAAFSKHNVYRDGQLQPFAYDKGWRQQNACTCVGHMRNSV